VVEFLVDLEGRVYETSVLQATDSGFIDEALRAVGRWRFEPGRCAGRKVRFRMSVPVVFRIDKV
jgi:TonB family protein